MKNPWIRSFWAALVCALGVPLPTVRQANAQANEYVVHSFGYGTDGSYPSAGLIDVNGDLYGTTSYGGAYGVFGSVFKINLKTGRETVLHSFGAGKDGYEPVAGLIHVNGMLYGTTQFGGAYGIYGLGTLFSVDPRTGAETVVYSFGATKKDGIWPMAGLISVKGSLYGTTVGGGEIGGGGGTVFAVDPSTGVERVLHAFIDAGGDGAMPQASLIDVNGMLYGTTWEGSAGDGTLFEVNPETGKEKVVYSFPTNGLSGGEPDAGLLDVNGALYGTTYYGGTYGYGVAFAFDPATGTETVLHSFGRGTDGRYPTASLIYAKGKLYGTTATGGTGAGCDSIGCGTVFAIDVKSGAQKILYSFCSLPNCADGYAPVANLIDVAGKIYGITIQGGSDQSCYENCGTVFALKNY